jgi:hypothetical protein
MREVFVGSEALATGKLTRGQLRWNYRALFPNVYADKDVTPSLQRTIAAAWLWAGGDAVIAGRAAAALYGALWVDANTPVEMIGRFTRTPRGIVVRNERIEADEIVERDGLLVTTPQRTAFDVARHNPRDTAVAHLDALARATEVKASDALLVAERYPRARGLPRSRIAIDLMDGGAQSPRETWLRLVLIDAHLPRPRTQIRVTDGFNEAFLDMGYDEPKIGLDYDGDKHFSDRKLYVHGIGRAELVDSQGWLDIHVVAEHSRRYVLHRVMKAFARRGYRPEIA